MKRLLLPVASLILALSFYPFSSSPRAEECSIEGITDQESSANKINDNFECIKTKLSSIDDKLEQILSRNEIVNKQDQSDKWSVTIGNAKITITEAVLKRLPNNKAQLVAEWRILNQSEENLMVIISRGNDTTMRITGDESRKADINGISSCFRPVDECSSWDLSKWTIISPGQLHGFSTSIAGSGIKMTAPSLSVNARFILHAQKNWTVRDVSFSDIPITP
jgi:hypothetical protein